MIGFLLVLIIGARFGTTPPAPATATAPEVHARAIFPAPIAAPAADTAVAARGGVADSVTVLPEVRVDQARALSGARGRVPTGFVTELRPRRASRALETVADLLGEAAGVHVVQYGGLGAFSTMSIRGLPAGEVAILLDGVPLTSAAHGAVNLADLPATAIDRIEIYRGATPIGFGAAAPGGAINVVTADPARLAALPLVHDLAATRGAFDTWEARATSALRRGRGGLVLHAGYQGSSGDFIYPDDNGTPYNPRDDSLSVRRNNRFAAASAAMAATWDPGAALHLVLREDAFDKRQGLPGLGATPALHPRLAFTRAITQLAATREARGVVPALSLGGALERERTRFQDANAELGLGRHDTDDRLNGEHAALALEWPRLPLGLSLALSGTLRDERAALADARDGRPDPPASRRRSGGAGAEMQWRALGEWITLRAARGWERVRDALRTSAIGVAPARDVARELASPQLGARIVPGGGLELRANWGRGEKPPEFLDLFGNQGSVLGNPALEPERVERWDAGAAWSGSFGGSGAGLAGGNRRGEGGGFVAVLEWAHFVSEARDLIIYVRNSQSSVKAQNIARARIRGDELSARIATPWGPVLSSALTFENAIDQGRVPFWRGNRLPQRPARQGVARLDCPLGRWRLGGEAQWLGDNYVDRANRQRIAARTLISVAGSVTLTERARLVIEGKNLGNQRAADVGGFPLPGRSAFASIHVHLGGSP